MFVGAVLLVAFVVAQTCQKDQIRVTKDGAIATAKRQIDFTPRAHRFGCCARG